MTPLLVAAGAAVGAPMRFLAAHLLDAARRHDGRSGWPWGTLTVNLLGSFVLGLLVADAVDGRAMALLGTGFCGGLTTYSAFAVQTVDGGRVRGPAYAVVTVGGCLIAATLGELAAGLLT